MTDWMSYNRSYYEESSRSTSACDWDELERELRLEREEREKEINDGVEKFLMMDEEDEKERKKGDSDS